MMSATVEVRKKPGLRQQGFTLLEVVFASAIIGFALLGLFALHNVAIRNNLHAGRLTTCAMLAQQKMEYLMGLPLPADGPTPTDLAVTGPDTDPTVNAYFQNPNGGLQPAPVNAKGTTSSADGPLSYYLTWNISEPFEEESRVLQIQVRVVFIDGANGMRHGVTISSFRTVDSKGYTGT